MICELCESDQVEGDELYCFDCLMDFDHDVDRIERRIIHRERLRIHERQLRTGNWERLAGVR